MSNKLTLVLLILNEVLLNMKLKSSLCPDSVLCSKRKHFYISLVCIVLHVFPLAILKNTQVGDETTIKFYFKKYSQQLSGFASQKKISVLEPWA